MKPTKIFLHHVAYNHSFYTVNQGHKKKKYPKSKLGWNIGYHKFIRNGKLWLGRSEDEDGMHNIGHNQDSLALAFDKNHEIIPLSNQDAKVAEKELLGMMNRWGITTDRIYGHCETDKTICPGKYVMEFLKEFKKKYGEDYPNYQEPITTPEKPSESVKKHIGIQLAIIKLKVEILKLSTKIYEHIKNFPKR